MRHGAFDMTGLGLLERLDVGNFLYFPSWADHDNRPKIRNRRAPIVKYIFLCPIRNSTLHIITTIIYPILFNTMSCSGYSTLFSYQVPWTMRSQHGLTIAELARRMCMSPLCSKSPMSPDRSMGDYAACTLGCPFLCCAPPSTGMMEASLMAFKLSSRGRPIHKKFFHYLYGHTDDPSDLNSPSGSTSASTHRLSTLVDSVP